MKRILMITMLVVVFTAAGCANMSRRQQQSLSGAAIGAGSGAVIGTVIGGSPALGAAVGGAAGAATGAFWDDITDALDGKRHRHR